MPKKPAVNQADMQAELHERQRAEAQLEQLLLLLGTILESTADGILAFDREGRVVRFNQQFVEMMRIPDEVIAFWKHDGIMEQLLSQVKDSDGFQVKLDGLRQHPEAVFCDVFECVDGRSFECYSMPPPAGVDGVGRVLSFRDVTARRRAEEALLKEKEDQKALIKKLEEAHNQLLQSEKMASIGQLAAGVAHEINNPIGFVSSNMTTLQNYVEGLLATVEAYERVEAGLAIESGILEEIGAVKKKIDLDYLRRDILDLLKESTDGVRRVRQIVQDLKDFSHASADEWQWDDLHKGIDSTLNIVRNEIKYKADVVLEYGEIPKVQCLLSQLNQVFMNMLVNASQAMGEARGVITIRTGAEGESAWVEFADTGKGIPPENLGRIFDPFFTTKPVGKGTGLGLSLSYGIVEKHHGRIEVESEVGKGTRFRIVLPVRQPED